jgi:hypothetical protein
MNPDENLSPLLERDFSGVIQNDRIVGIFPNPPKHEMIFVCALDNFQIVYYKFLSNKLTDKRQVTLQKIEVDPKN